MTRSTAAADVDLRAFAWPLAPLQLRLEVSVQQASAEVARREHRRLAIEAELEAMREDHDAQLRVLQSPAHRVDPSQHRQALEFLAHALGRLRTQEQALAQCSGDVEEARRAHVAADRQLNRLREMHGDAVAAYAVEQRRRAAKEADGAWVATLARVRGRARRRSEP